jgi:hypothetical protein
VDHFHVKFAGKNIATLELEDALALTKRYLEKDATDYAQIEISRCMFSYCQFNEEVPSRYGL